MAQKTICSAFAMVNGLNLIWRTCPASQLLCCEEMIILIYRKFFLLLDGRIRKLQNANTSAVTNLRVKNIATMKPLSFQRRSQRRRSLLRDWSSPRNRPSLVFDGVRKSGRSHHRLHLGRHLDHHQKGKKLGKHLRFLHGANYVVGLSSWYCLLYIIIILNVRQLITCNFLHNLYVNRKIGQLGMIYIWDFE